MNRLQVAFLLALVVGLMVLSTILPQAGQADDPVAALRAKYSAKAGKSVDHSKFPSLQKTFAKPGEVTAACIECHNQRHTEVMQSSHWKWARSEYVEGRGIVEIGKKNVLNNFCVGVRTNEQSCAKCHIGYGNHNKPEEYNNPLNVDCLACHDNSGTYVKATGGAGLPDKAVNLTLVAKSVGSPQRTNCGTCHFFGGGGNNVKHGDLEMALFDPNRELDVHMASEGADMQCVACHTAEKHQMLGKVYSLSSMNRNRVECSSCHGELPHKDAVVNRHTLKVACQTCHIPTYAKANPTKLEWDWSTAGKLKDGKPYEEKAEDGTDSYMSIKGSFKWGKNLAPDYVWFNGNASHYLLGDKMDPANTTVLNPLHGSYDDPDAKIIPVKVHRAKQIYDSELNILIQPKTFSDVPGDGGYWAEFDWNKAAAAGMKQVGLPFSGKYGFAKTEMLWPINHMVAPKSETLACAQCHTRDKGRLASLKGFYMPGRDRNTTLDGVGSLLAVLTLVGVGAHGAARLVARRRTPGGPHA